MTPPPLAAATRNNHGQPGFTLLELIVVVIIIGVLATTLLNRMQYYQEQAERSAMEQVAASIQTALLLQYGHMLANGQEAEVRRLTTENPMQWLAKRPPNYAGEFFQPKPSSTHPGNWLFDLKSRDLIYFPAWNNYLKPARDGQKWIRFHVELLRDSGVGKAADTSTQKPPSGVLFVQDEPGMWTS